MVIAEFILVALGAIAYFAYGITYRDENGRLKRDSRVLIIIALMILTDLLTINFLNIRISFLLLLLVILVDKLYHPGRFGRYSWLLYLLVPLLVAIKLFNVYKSYLDGEKAIGMFLFGALLAVAFINNIVKADKKRARAIIPVALSLAIIIFEIIYIFPGLFDGRM